MLFGKRTLLLFIDPFVSRRSLSLIRAQVEIVADVPEVEREGGWACKTKTSLQRIIPGFSKVTYGLTLHDSGLTLGGGWLCPSFEVPLTRELRDLRGATHAVFNRRSAEFEVRDRKGKVLATVPTTWAAKVAAVAAKYQQGQYGQGRQQGRV